MFFCCKDLSIEYIREVYILFFIQINLANSMNSLCVSLQVDSHRNFKRVIQQLLFSRQAVRIEKSMYHKSYHQQEKKMIQIQVIHVTIYYGDNDDVMWQELNKQADYATKQQESLQKIKKTVESFATKHDLRYWYI